MWGKRLLAWLLMAVVFVIVNRAAFEGYFSDDDLDNLSWTTVVAENALPAELVSPVFSEKNVRPVGAYFYRWTGRAFGLDYQKYIPWLFGLHLLNGALLYLLLRRKECSEQGAWAGMLFFVFHAALLEAWWKPMYIFDLSCATLILLSWLLIRNYWPLAWLAFWLAYKAKEIALFFPVLLLMDALLLQQGRLWVVTPFLLTSLSFGVQAVLVNRARDNNYTLRFGLESLWVCLSFYWRQAGLSRFGAALLLPLAYLGKDKQVWISLAGCLALMTPLLFLPTRLFSVYLYVPFVALAVAVGFSLAKVPRWALALGMGLWLLWNWQVLRQKRNEELQAGQETRAFVEQLKESHQRRPFGDRVVIDSVPPRLRPHGVRGALRLISGNSQIAVLNSEQEVKGQLEANQEYAALSWSGAQKKLEVDYHQLGEARLTNLEFAVPSALWQLGSGWYEKDGGFRWTAKEAVAYLAGNPYSRTLQVRYNIAQQLVEAVGTVRVKLYLNGEFVGESGFSQAGIPVVDYPLPKTYGGKTEVKFIVSPGFEPPGDGRMLGVAIWGLGFVM